MKLVPCLVCLLAVAFAQAPPSPGPELAQILNFEAAPVGGRPSGWSFLAEEVVHDGDVVHAGNGAVRIERSAAAAGSFSTITKALSMDFAGQSITLRGYIKTENVSDAIALWMRQDGTNPNLAFATLQSQGIRGTRDWAQYSINLPIHAEARQLAFGFLLVGTGKAWADDLELLVDGQPIWVAPKKPLERTVLDEDHAFDQGSRVTMTSLTGQQIENLVQLGKVWGFLKYHHPAIVAGARHWDYELFRVLPQVLAVASPEQAADAMVTWIDALGPVPDCGACVTLNETNLHLRPDLGWITGDARRRDALGTRLRDIYINRAAEAKQFYLDRVSGVGNPIFQHELSYGQVTGRDAGFQLLALYRFWNIIEYWFPYRDQLDQDWDAVLREFIPRVALAADRTAYQLEMMALIARVTDTHANLWSSIGVRPPTGTCFVAAEIRFIEGVPAVARLFGEPNLQAGDVLLAIAGEQVTTLIDRWRPYYAASNEPTRFRDIGRSMTCGACGPVDLRVRRDGREIDVTVQRRAVTLPSTHDRPGDTFQKLASDIAYLKLSSVKAADAPQYVRDAAGTRGLIIDIRNYPSEFMPFALGALLTPQTVPFARFTGGDPQNPGAFHFTDPLAIAPSAPHYTGKVAVLVDEVSQSQAEYTAMAFRAAGAIIVGSTTAGADGNVSEIPLPGGLRSMISGIGVFYPDRTPTQRIGIVPDIQVGPTLAGVREGRDEVLEAAMAALRQ